MAKRRSPLLFFALLLALALPVWLASARFGVLGSLRIPVSDLVLAFAPMSAALILVTWREGWRAAASLLGTAFDPTSLRARHLALALILAPLIYAITWLVMRALGSQATPAPDALRLAGLFALFVVLATGEEVGWMGYAFDPLQQRWGALGASLILAGPWWLGHLPSMHAIGARPPDLAAWALGAVALRVLFGWLYNLSGGALVTAVVFHAMLNLGRIATYPATEAHYSSAWQVTGYLVAAILACAVILRGRRPERRTRSAAAGKPPARV